MLAAVLRLCCAQAHLSKGCELQGVIEHPLCKGKYSMQLLPELLIRWCSPETQTVHGHRQLQF